MNTVSEVLELSATKSGDNPRLARMSRQAQGEYEAVVRLMDFWKKTFESSAAISSEMLKTLLRAIKTLIVRIAALFGVAIQAVNDRRTQAQESEAGDDVSEKIPDVKFVGDKDKVEGAAAMAKQTGEKLIEAAAETSSMEGDKGIEAALAKLESELRALQAQHDVVLKALEPKIHAAAAALGMEDSEEVFRQFVNDDDGIRELIDPRRELQPDLGQIAAHRESISDCQRLFCSMASAHIQETGRRDVVAPFLSPGRLDYLSARIKDIAENSANSEQFDQNSVAGNGDSGNNLVSPDLASAEDRAQELPPQFSRGLPAGDTVPVGVKRFAALIQQSVDDFDEVDEQEAQAKQEHAQKA